MGFPQFDVSTYPSQIFWLLVCSVVLSVFVKVVFLPRLGAILDTRNKRIQGDLEKAKEITETTQKKQSEYDDQLEQNRMRARHQRDEQMQEFSQRRQERLDRQMKNFVRKRALLEKGGFFELPPMKNFVTVLLGENKS